MNRKQRRAVGGPAHSSGPSAGNDLQLRRLAGAAVEFHRSGRLAEAEKSYIALLAGDPRNAQARYLLGTLYLQTSRVEAGIRELTVALADNPNNPGGLNNLGNALKAVGRVDEAIARFNDALRLRPDYPEALNSLGTALKAAGRLDEAVCRYRDALRLKPDFAEALSNLGSALEKQGKLDEAILHFEKAARLRPDLPGVQNNLANALREKGRIEEAIIHYFEAVRLKPDFVEALNNLAGCLKAKGRYDEAVERYAQALRLKPDFPEALNGLGSALERQGLTEQAIIRLNEALRLKPDFPEALNNLGNALRVVGRFDEAKGYTARALELAPNNIAFHYSMSGGTKYKAGDPHLAAMEALAQDVGQMREEDQVYLHFALAKAYEDIGEKDRSFDHLLAGNALKRRQETYDEAAVLKQFETIKTAFSAEVMREKSAAGAPPDGPIFIVGMPRSGSTLVEQILASHSQVSGAGEVDLFAKAAKGLYGLKEALPEAVKNLSADDLNRIATTYLASLRALAPNALRITDKMLHNFLFCGLIHLAVPNARIIHTRRDPIDTCLSCFSKLFSAGQYYTYDLDELGRHYRGYEAMMEHWHQVMPPGILIDVQYEDVVADLEGQARRILEHCGLEWDDACLSFYKTERAVRTASVTQVRQPIYTSSVGRWRPAPELLKPLLDALGPLAKL